MDTIPGEQSEAPAYHASRRFLLPTFAIIWFCAVGTGMSWMWEYESTPGPEALPGSQWPSDSSIARSEELPTLVLFAHPRCPCTRATMRELELIVAHCTQKLDVQVIFFRPEGASGGWERTDIWAAAESLPGVTVTCDEGGQEAKRFDATTSGFALLFDRWGNLLFSGGNQGKLMVEL